MNRLASRAVILLYHRVAESNSDPQWLCVTPKHFAEHLEILRKHSYPMQLQQLVQALRDGDLPNLAVILTFDDGYADNLYNAKPLLLRYELPATVFVTTGYLGDGREFWWDELDRLVLQPGMLPETVHLTVKGKVHRWELGENTHYDEDDCLRHRGWNVLEQEDPTPRHYLYRSLFQMLCSLSEKSRRKVLNELLGQAAPGLITCFPHRALSPDEVFRLAEGGVVEVGSHTMTHPVLSVLPASAQWAEIKGSKSRLEEILGSPVTSLSYPYGSQSDYMPQTVAFAREAGYSCACSNFPGLAIRSSDHYQLPRILVRDWDGEEFLRRMKVWFRDQRMR